MDYTPPTPEDLDRLRTELGKTSGEMAELFGLANGRQWRRYLSETDSNGRDMGMHMLFFAMARLSLSAEAVDAVMARMRKVGARVNLSAAGEQDS